MLLNLKRVRFLQIAKVAGAIFLGASVFYLLFKELEPSVMLVEKLRNVDSYKLVIASMFVTASYFTRVAAWQKFLSRFRRHNYWVLFRSTMIGYLANNVLPARLGDVVRGAWLLRTFREEGGVIFGTLLLERMLDVLIVLVFLALSFSRLRFYSSELLQNAILIGMMVVLLLAIILVLRWLVAREGGFLFRFISNTRWFTNNPSIPILGRVRDVARDFGNSLTLATALRGFLWSLITWIVTFWGLYFSLDSLGLASGFGIAGTAIMLSTSSLGIAIPSLPASVGVYQGAFVLGATLTGLPKTEALVASILYQTLWVCITSVLGIISLLWEGSGICNLLSTVKLFNRKRDK